MRKKPHATWRTSTAWEQQRSRTDADPISGVDNFARNQVAADSDRGRYAMLLQVTKGDVLIKNVIPKHLEATTAKLEEIGCDVRKV